MSETCEKCPCPASCLKWPVFCDWAAEDPPDEIKIRHIRARSAREPEPQDSPVAVRDDDLAAQDDRPDVRESIELVKAMRICPFRSTGPGCGCQGGRCSLRRGAVVNHIDCMDCLKRYPGP